MSKLIDPNELEVPPDIKAAAISGSLTFFIGNGVSRLYGIPSWDELANQMLDRLVDCGKLNHSTHDILSRYPTKTKISIADHFFKENLKTLEHQTLNYNSVLIGKHTIEELQKKTPIYDLLAASKVRFITTNYDSLLSNSLTKLSSADFVIQDSKIDEDSGASSGVKPQDKVKYDIYKSLSDFPKVGLARNNMLLHLHGSISDEETLIASTQSYLNMYGNKENQELLRLLFKNQTIVFIGYGLEELEILDLIIRSGSTESSTEDNPRFFLILSLLSHESEILDYLKIYYEKQLGVTLLPYCRDDKGYLALKDIIENWTKELCTIAQEPSRVMRLELIDELMDEFDRTQK